MKYNLKINSQTNPWPRHELIFELDGHKFIDSVTIYAIGDDDSAVPECTFYFRIKGSSYYNQVVLDIYQREIISLFPTFDLKARRFVPAVSLNSKEQAIVLAFSERFFSVFEISNEDKEKTKNFLTSIFEQKDPMDLITSLIRQDKLQEALDKAVLSENQGHANILYKTAETFFNCNYLQYAYLAFSSVPKSDPNYKLSQITAGKLAASSVVKFTTEQEKIEAVFKYCSNAGDEGQAYIDNFFKNLMNAKDLQIKNIQTNFATIYSFATILAQQNQEIENLRKELKAARSANSQYTNPSNEKKESPKPG